jgi:hypothetical protein
MARDQVSLRLTEASVTHGQCHPGRDQRGVSKSSGCLSKSSHSKCLRESVESARILVAIVMEIKWKYRISEIAEMLRL